MSFLCENFLKFQIQYFRQIKGYSSFLFLMSILVICLKKLSISSKLFIGIKVFSTFFYWSINVCRIKIDALFLCPLFLSIAIGLPILLIFTENQVLLLLVFFIVALFLFIICFLFHLFLLSLLFFLFDVWFIFDFLFLIS